MIDPDQEEASNDMRKLKAWLYWIYVGFCLFCAAILLGLCVPAHAQVVTFSKPIACAKPTVSRRGDDVLIRCNGEIKFTIANQPLTCPGIMVTRDAAGNILVRCP